MKIVNVLVFALLISILISCGNNSKNDKQSDETQSVEVSADTPIDPMTDKGVGPITHIELGEIDQALVTKGENLFTSKCSACHKIEKRFIGPAIKGVTERRTPEWIMNMILNPEVMVEKNEEAKKLLAEYLSPMANQSLTEDEARAILEYFRTQ